jgi:hypothetical protein
MNTAIIGIWLIAASLVWLASVIAVVVMGLSSHMEADRRNGCGGRGCRRSAGGQGCNTTPRGAETARGFSPGWKE